MDCNTRTLELATIETDTRELSERELVEMAKLRDTDAFAQLYDRHAARVFRHIYYVLGNLSEAEDLTAQTFLQAWEAIGRYQHRGSPFVSWLLRIGHNLAISHLRSRRDKAQLPEKLIDETSRRDPEQVAELHADEDRVRRAILHLRDEQRQVIVLRFVDELEYTEVAEIVGKSVAAVRVIQHRALNNLRKEIQAEEQLEESEAAKRNGAGQKIVGVKPNGHHSRPRLAASG